MRKETKRLSAIRDAGRLINLRDVLSQVGTILYRRSFKYALIAFVFSTAGFVAHSLGLPGFTKKQAIGFPIVVGTGAFFLGLLLRYVPTIISSRLQTVAQAADLNLMEDYRKKRAAHYLAALWDRVYRYEAELLFGEEERKEEKKRIEEQKLLLQSYLAGLPPALKKQLGEPSCEELAEAVLSLRPLSKSLPKTKEGFLLEGRYALRSFDTQASDRFETGVDFSIFEDWCDGAFFDRSDTKLMEKYSGDTVICTVRRLVKMPLRFQLAELWYGLSQRFWFLIATRALALEVATAVRYLNSLYSTSLLNAQTLLWPGAEEQEAIKRLGAEDAVRSWRKRIISKVFGNSPAEQFLMIDRMFFGTYACATHLRMLFDPEYCDGSLDYDLCSDVSQEGCKDAAFYREFCSRTKRECSLLEAYLKAFHPEVLQDREGKRAVKITFHINRLGFKEDFFRMPSFGYTRVAWHIDRALRRKARYTERLRRIRAFHELCRLQLQEYRDLISRLAQ